MISLSQYYEEKLYPLQNGVLTIVKECKTPFFLTGGTALSRGYYNHRYSDDLDFFVNDDNQYQNQVKLIIKELQRAGFFIDKNKDFILRESFTSLKVSWDKSDALLKLDFVNDVPAHFGNIIETQVFYRTDSIRNMISNKLGALFRYASKDVADIREISLHEHFNWGDILKEVREKDTGLELPSLAEVLKGMPEKFFNAVNWVKNPTWEVFYKDIQQIAIDMINVGDNSLVNKKT